MMVNEPEKTTPTTTLGRGPRCPALSRSMSPVVKRVARRRPPPLAHAAVRLVPVVERHRAATQARRRSAALAAQCPVHDENQQEQQEAQAPSSTA